MLGLSYERLDRITRTVKPYRGSLDRFPLTTRKQNTKNFYVREKNGVRVFDVVYGDRTKSTSLTHEEYLEMKSLGIPKLHEYKYHNGKTEYWLYETVRHVLGTVYPEGFFQFNKDINEFGQGDRAILSEFSSGWFTNDTRRGGMIWTNGRGSGLQVIPIYKGARFSTTNIPHIIDDYEVIGRKVNRKVGKDILGGYESFYKTAETMCKAMSEDMFLDIAKEVLNDCKDKYYETAESLRDQSPLDAMILYCVALDIGRIPYRANHRNWYHSTPHEDFNSLKRTLNKRIYKENPEVFTPVRYFKGEAFPPSIWGYEIEVNGQKVEQY